MKELDQYRKASEQEAVGSPNEFFPVKQIYLEKLREEIGQIPEGLEKFWNENGYGFLQQAASGGRPSNFTNMFLAPSTIADYLKKNRYRKHLIQGDEMAVPFFTGDDDVFLGYVANGPLAGSIVTYGPDRAVVSESIKEFVMTLLQDPEFYAKAGAVPPETRWLV